MSNDTFNLISYRLRWFLRGYDRELAEDLIGAAWVYFAEALREEPYLLAGKWCRDPFCLARYMYWRGSLRWLKVESRRQRDSNIVYLPQERDEEEQAALRYDIAEALSHLEPRYRRAWLLLMADSFEDKADSSARGRTKGHLRSLLKAYRP